MSQWRLVAPAILAGSLAACGFHPLYAPGGATNTAMSHVFVDVIPNRNGQLLRQALQQRLEGSGEGEKHYILSVSYVESAEGIGIESDNVSTRNRVTAHAEWTLKDPGAAGATLAHGSARGLDGENNIAGQFFYGDLNGEAIDRRMGEMIADQIVQQMAAWFRAHPNAA